MPDAGRALTAAKYRADLALDRPFAAAAPVLGASVRRHAERTPDGPRITEAARRAILADVESVLGPLYGRKRGDPGHVGALVVRHAATTYADGMRAGADDLRGTLDGEPELTAMLEGGER